MAKTDSMKHPFRFGQLPPDRAARVGISAPAKKLDMDFGNQT
jgi:hypothetical protein